MAREINIGAKVQEIFDGLDKLRAENSSAEEEIKQWRNVAREVAEHLPVPLEPVSNATGKGTLRTAQELAQIATEEALENVAENAAKATAKKLGQSPPPLPPPPAQQEWFYARENRASGPVLEKELAELLRNGLLPWDTLVWSRTLEGWTAAEETELAKLVKASGPPPPLPSGPPKAAPAATTPQLTCSKCGTTSKPGDRFCSGCGQSLSPVAMTVKYCPKCGQQAADAARFCRACGTSLAR